MADQNFTKEEFESEEWRDIPGNPGYQASNIGRVRSVKITILKSHPGRNPAYLSVSLQRKGTKARSRGVHQLVAAAFIGPRPSGMLVNHKDTNKRNNRLENLEYRTHQGNAQHASENGLLLVGQDNPASKLSVEQVREIIQRLATGESAKSICRDYPVSDCVIGLIRQNRAWKHVPRPASRHLGRVSTGRTYGEDSSSAKITEAKVLTMRREYAEHKSLGALCKMSGLKKSQVWRIVTRKSWPHI